MLPLMICCQEGISSPSMSAQILDFCDDGDLFPETSCGGGAGPTGAGSGGGVICCFDDTSFPSDLSPYPSMDASALSTLLDSELQSDPEPDVNLPVNYPSSQLPPPPATAFPAVLGYLSNPQDPLDQVGFPEMAAIDGYSSYLSESLVDPLSAAPRPAPPQPPPSLPIVFDDECISTLSSYMGLEPSPSCTSCSFMDPTGQLGVAFYPETFGVSATEEGMGFFPGSMAAGQETGTQAPEVMVEYRGESSDRGGGVGIFGLDSTSHQRIYGGPGELQALGDHQQLVNGCVSPTAPPASDMPTLEESTFKVGRLSVEERKERIHRYLKKRNERNFSKKIKYACRKTLADSRPRVRGRFAKNDEFGSEPTRPASGNHEDEDEEDVGVKEEEDITHSSDIYAHLSSMTSFKCNYSALEFWI